MAKQKLNKTIVERIPPGAQDLVVWDAALEGFGVRVKPTGVKSYIVQYRNRITGASKRLTLARLSRSHCSHPTTWSGMLFPRSGPRACATIGQCSTTSSCRGSGQRR